MNPKYVPKTLDQHLGYLIEECGETMAAVGKTIRWGLWSTNPELPEPHAERECNRDWILREMRDLREALDRAEPLLRELERPKEGA